MSSKTMRRFVISHRNGIDGLALETDAPVPELQTPTDVSDYYRPVSSY
jgi:hypothetical protein